ncbi:MAG: hypothetical protein O3A84_14875, partial [Proteobacteria bacterium]|nr:hypothetical protein [Pseudomonadota bacterium]
MKHFRLLPILIFCAAFTLSLKVGSLWQGISAIAASSETSDKDAGKASAAGDGNQKMAKADGEKAESTDDKTGKKTQS